MLVFENVCFPVDQSFHLMTLSATAAGRTRNGQGTGQGKKAEGAHTHFLKQLLGRGQDLLLGERGILLSSLFINAVCSSSKSLAFFTDNICSLFCLLFPLG